LFENVQWYAKYRTSTSHVLTPQAWKRVAAKRAEEAQLTDKAQRRERKKRKTRRICQGANCNSLMAPQAYYLTGMCWKDPELTADDKKWNGKVDDDSEDDGGNLLQV
jgi:hypothetical protein